MFQASVVTFGLSADSFIVAVVDLDFDSQRKSFTLSWVNSNVGNEGVKKDF